jgi:Single-strand binding protein family.
MIDALISGKLIRDPVLKTGPSGKSYANFLLSVSVADEQPVIVSGIAFSGIAERIALLKKGDPLSVIGSLKPSEWQDKATNETKHGLSVTVNNSLSPYDIKKRRPTQDAAPKTGNARPFDDNFEF